MKCFVIMPFSKEFDDVYDTIKMAVNSAVPGEKIECFRLDELKTACKISEDLVRAIQDSTICIADLTGNNANVMWEVGYAMALNKPILTISQEIEDLPFDLKDWRTICYDRQSLSSSLREILAESFRDTLGSYKVRRESVIVDAPKNTSKTIAITGSSALNTAKCDYRLDKALKPFLDQNITWLCGSFGNADECVIRYLARNNQNIIVVGYHSYDISENILKLINDNDIPFIDAKNEQIPLSLGATSERDMYFLIKSDLFIALWNGKSHETKRLIGWFKSQKKDLLVCFT